MKDRSLQGRRLQVAVAGWRFIEHSYAMHCQWNCLSLLRRNDVAVSFSQQPFFKPHWTEKRGVFSAEDEDRLAAMPPPEVGAADIEYRVDFPHNFGNPSAGKALTFATGEYGVLLDENVRRAADPSSSSVGVITPAYWNVDAFVNAGFSLDRIFVVPHGVDPSIFRPRPEVREQVRTRLGLKGFVFMNTGAIFENKGVDLLLAAFTSVAGRRSDAQLLLKGTDNLYRAKEIVEKHMNQLGPGAGDLLASRLVYVGETLSNEQMSFLYQAADCYVAPYRAEGFGMPVLEAAACGLPIISTQGGPTDDFINEDFSKKIRSQLRISGAANHEGIIVKSLEPDLGHLIELMHQVADDRNWRERARGASAQHAHTHFSWDRVTGRLVEAFYRMHEGKGA